VKPNPNESYESWCERVRMFEHGAALQEIALGKDPNEVMEKMSRKIMNKLLHPLYQAINESVKIEDAKDSRTSYEEKMKYRGLVADHVDKDT